MGSYPKRRPGNLMAIPLTFGGFGYARVLNKLVAIYDRKSAQIENCDFVIGSPIAFTVNVHVSAFSKGRWAVIGFKSLEPIFNEPTKFYRRDLSGSEYLIWVSIPTSKNSYEEYPASAVDCIGLEPMLSWDPKQLEERIDDHFSGRENRAILFYREELENKLKKN